MSGGDIYWRRMAEVYFEKWRSTEEELERLGEDESVMVRDGSGGDLYRLAVYWIVKERGGAGGWPPHDVGRVSGWTVVRLVADLFGRAPAEVARDVIQTRNKQDTPMGQHTRREGRDDGSGQ
jgi:hypothetical protein